MRDPSETESEVRIWHLDLDALADTWPEASAHLDDAERKRAAAFRHAVDAHRWTVCRAALRVLLSTALHCRPTDVPIESGPNGKPFVNPGPGPRVGFNVSHSRSDALIALSGGIELGIDLESIASFPSDPDPSDLATWSSVFPEAERAWLSALGSPSQRARGAMRLWTAREATLKWSGTGFLAPVDSTLVAVDLGVSWVGIPHGSVDPRSLMRDPDVPVPAGVHRLRLIELELSESGCIGFMALAHDDPTVIRGPVEWKPPA